MQFPMFEALAQGYLASAGDFLSNEEKQYLAFSGKLITLETGLRFLADHLNGDTYFKIHREGQNLDRCRTQFKLVQSIEQQEEQMQQLILRDRAECSHASSGVPAGSVPVRAPDSRPDAVRFSETEFWSGSRNEESSPSSPAPGRLHSRSHDPRILRELVHE